MSEMCIYSAQKCHHSIARSGCGPARGVVATRTFLVRDDEMKQLTLVTLGLVFGAGATIGTVAHQNSASVWGQGRDTCAAWLNGVRLSESFLEQGEMGNEARRGSWTQIARQQWTLGFMSGVSTAQELRDTDGARIVEAVTAECRNAPAQQLSQAVLRTARRLAE